MLRPYDSKLYFDVLGFDVLENAAPTQFHADPIPRRNQNSSNPHMARHLC
jgi:hypothetical protein